MPYTATVYNVMIASPSDVDEERATIREVIMRWNFTHSMNAGRVLIPIGWETHSAPLMGTREERPQAVINDMVLKHADLLVGIFKDRLGSPTGREASGTVEEIKEHHSLGKPVLLYFGHAAGDAEQAALVREYKEDCKKRGIVCEYEDCQVLRERFSDHLQLVINGLRDERERSSPPDIRPIGVPGESFAIVEGSVPNVEEKTKILLIELLQDPKGQISVSKFIGEEVKIETSGGRFFGFERALIQLERSRWIQKADEEGRIFSLTDLGYQEASKIKPS